LVSALISGRWWFHICPTCV